MTIVLATGGSGGHIFPALQTALELKKRGHEVVFAGALSSAQSKIEAAGFACHNLALQGFTDRSLLGTLHFAGLMARAIGLSVGILRRVKPQKVVGFGGYGCVPVVLAACQLRLKTMTHEQNVKPGKANRILGRLVAKVAVSFKDSLPYFGPRAVWTGCPCHDQPSARSRQDICRDFGLNPGERIVALLGGSQGSQKLNGIFFEAMPMLAQRRMQAIHMTGPKEYEAYVQKYGQLALPVKVSAFISPIEDLYAVAGAVIARAGAATVSELGALGVASLLVPYPFAGGHQRYNARVLERAQAALVIEQNDLTVEGLLAAIDRLGAPEFDRAQLKSKTAPLFAAGAAGRLADAIEEL